MLRSRRRDRSRMMINRCQMLERMRRRRRMPQKNHRQLHLQVV
ncbi:hypothetical protein LINPERPRIM_LOCUS11761 [Linum perenne]